jgi:predicted Zn-dependent protease
MAITKEYFEDLVKKTLDDRRSGEHFYFSLSAEESQFIRINGAKVRQIGTVEDADLEITMVLEAGGQLRKASRMCSVTGLSWVDAEVIAQAIVVLRTEVAELPVDPYAQLPSSQERAVTETRGRLLPVENAVQALLIPEVASLDLAGIYASGSIIRAMANSAGQLLWFSTENFSFDYSLYTGAFKALKGTFAGKEWDAEKYAREMANAAQKLQFLQKPSKQIARGSYRTYLAPACLNDLLEMMSWGCLSEAAIRQGSSPLRLLRSGERELSPLFSLSEDFRGGEVPRFNELGEIAPEVLPLIRQGKFENSLISARTAKEYGLTSNGASFGEGTRSPVVAPGTLFDDRVLSSLGTGLYLSNLHYLNWSDQPGGRITGMTRYACFWVENSEIVAPIENMRWDDSIFALFGSELEALTSSTRLNASVGSYFRRNLGGTTTPGAIIKQMKFTI